MSELDLAHMRVEYGKRSLSEKEMDADPVKQLLRWLEEAVEAKVQEPNAMTLATCRGARPSARVVLLKELDGEGLVFCSNYQSRKGGDLESNSHAALVFWWPELERQVRVEGTVTRTSAEQSVAYFNRRPAGAKLAAAASPQSQAVASREELERRVAELARQYPDGAVPAPPHWGGYRLRPLMIEFWQGGVNRLHDRIEYGWNEKAGWVIRRLAP